jgi:hypothetical protein
MENPLLGSVMGIASPKERSQLMMLLQRLRQPQQPNVNNPVTPGYVGNTQAFRNTTQQGPLSTPYGRPMPPMRIFNRVQ